MTSNYVNVAKPEAGASVNYNVPAGESAQLPFGPADITGLSLNESGGLVISLADGGKFTITNFQSVADAGNVLYLSDGTIVDPKTLQSSLSQPTNDNGDAIIVIGAPSDNVIREITLEPGQAYALDFNPADAQGAVIENGQLVITFDNEGSIVIVNYEEAQGFDLPAELSLTSSDTIISGEELITTIQLAQTQPGEELLIVVEEEEVAQVEPAAGEAEQKVAQQIEQTMAQELAQIEPAAGEPGATGRGGYGFNSSPAAEPFQDEPAVGPIDPTLLNYGIPEPSYNKFMLTTAAGPLAATNFNPNLPTINELVDESFINGGVVTETGTVVVDFGSDAPGTITPSGTFSATGSLLNGLFTHNGANIVVIQTATGYEGYAGGTLIFDISINANTGDYTFHLYENLDHDDETNPNDIIALNFGIVATDDDGDQAFANIVVSVRDDAPVLDNASGTVDETNLPGPVVLNGAMTADFGEDGAGTVTATGTFSAGGSLAGGNLTSNGVAVNVTFNSGTNTYTGMAGGTTVFTLVVQSNGSFTFTLHENLDHADPNDPNDIITLNFGALITDYDGDTDPGTITINVQDDVPTFQNGGPQPDQGLETVDETNLSGGVITETGTLTADFGADAPGTYGFISGGFSSTGSKLGGNLTHNGTPVNVSFVGNVYTGTAGGTTIFTLTLNPATGAYEFKLFENLDHADGANPNDQITLNFGVNAIDSEGDTAPGVIRINVLDDAPDAGPNQIETIDESNLGPIVEGGNLAISFGQDGAGSAAGTGSFASSGSLLGGNLTSGGVPVNVTFNAGTNTYTGMAGGTTVFTLVIQSNGAYVFTLNENLDHADPNDPNDIITLNFGAKATDYDGDSDTANIIINVRDDVPTFQNGGPQPDKGQETVDETNLSGGVITETGTLDADFGADAPGSYAFIGGGFTSGGSKLGGTLSHNGTPVNVSFAGNVYTGTAGGTTIFTLTLNPTTGGYEFKLFENLDHANGADPNDVITLNFGVNAIDSEGDTVAGTILINVRDDAPDAINDTDAAVEGGSTSGNVRTNDDQGEDQPSFVTQITFGGTTLPVPSVGTVSINGTFGTLEIAADGSYTYTVTDPNNPDGTDTFTYTLRDYDGDTDTATLAIRVTALDDQPVIVEPITETIDETALSGGNIVETGTVTANFGGDGPGTFSGNNTFSSGGSLLGGNLTHNGTPVNVTFNAGTNTYTGTAGGTTIFTMVIQANGNYTFTLFENLDHANPANPNDSIALNFGVTATDNDGDTDTATITVNVLDDAPDAGANQTETIDETNLGPIVENGSLVPNYGQDGPGSAAGTGTFAPSGSLAGGVLTSGGVPVNVAFNAGTNTYTGTAGGATVFTLVIQANGQYTFTLHKALDHADPNNPNDIITLTFGAKVTDYDGDSDTANIIINVQDDIPTFQPGDPQPDKGYEVVDETNLSGGVITETGTLDADFGGDVPGSYAFISGGFSSSGSKLGGNLTHNGTPVNVSFAGNVYTGTAGGTTIFTLTLNPTTGGYEFKLFENLDHADGANPNDVITLDFGVNAIDREGDKVAGSIRIDVRDDAPDAGANQTETIDETNLGPIVENGSLVPNFGADGAGSAAGTGTFAPTGSMAGGNLTSGGVAVNVTFNAGTNTYTGTAGGATVFTLVIQANGNYTFTLHKPLDHANPNDPNDIITLTFGAKVTDYDGDSDTANIIINVKDDAPVFQPGGPLPDSGQETVDESNLGPITETGNLNADFGSDVPGTYAFIAGGFTPGGSLDNGTLSSDGVPITVSLSGNTYTGTAGGVTVFTLTLNPATGAYSFTLHKNLDHADDTDPNDIITLTFGVRASDREGDSANGVIRINVLDDVPIIVPGIANVDESNLGPSLVAGDVTLPGNNAVVSGTNSFSSSGSKLGGNLTHNGVAVNVTYNAATKTYTGAAGGTTVFTLEIESDGQWVFTLFQNLDHADGANPNDVINLVFGVQSVDQDGDTDDATITIQIIDDAPVAVNDVATFNEAAVKTGNVLTNDDVGADDPGRVTQITFGGTTLNVPNGGSVNIAGAFGTLTINSNGTYTYVLSGNIVDNKQEVFTYKMVDRDGDPATANLTINITAVDDKPTLTAAVETIDESNLGPIVETGSVSPGYGADGPGTVTGTNSFSSSGSKLGGNLTHNGTPVVVTFNAGTNTYTGTAGGVTVFTLVIQSNGNYTFTLHQNLDHNDPNNPNDSIALVFGVKATDSDGDVTNSTITINVLDDAPVAVADTNTVNEGGPTTATGNVLTNDDAGEDNPAVVTQITFGGNTVNVPSAGTININGAYGTLTIAANGSYTYTRTVNVPSDKQDVFTYKLKDSDGDTATSTLTINVNDEDDIPTVVVTAPQTVDETNLASSTYLQTTGKVTADFGDDAPGTLTGTTFTAAGSLAGGTLKHNGTAVVVTWDAGTRTFTGKAGATTVFTLALDAVGNYTFRLYQHLDHADGSNPNDIIELRFAVRATDSDGDNANTTILIKVQDDVPNAGDLDCTVYVPNGSFSSNALAGSSAGQDAPMSLSAISFGATTVNIPTSGANVTINGAYGYLSINKTGAYTYYVTNPNAPTNTETFTFTVKDFDGDTDTATLDVNLIGSNLVGTNGNDTLFGGSAGEIIDARGGVDWIEGRGGNDTIYGGDGNDSLLGNEGNDTIYGQAGDDNLYGDDNDTDTYSGNDVVHGGDGNDFIDGGSGTDTLNGDAGNDTVYGWNGNDTIHGGAGNDILAGEKGVNQVWGDAGADTFKFFNGSFGAGNQDVIKDFNKGEGDKLDLSSLLTGFDELTESINNFVFATHSGGNTVISVDKNGTGNAGNATVVATLEGVTENVLNLYNNGHIIT